jgi:hypothetical protein
MAKRGRKKLVDDNAVVHKDIMCQACGKMIDNSDGKPTYSLVTYWDASLPWLVSKRMHQDCVDSFVDALPDGMFLSASNTKEKALVT